MKKLFIITLIIHLFASFLYAENGSSSSTEEPKYKAFTKFTLRDWPPPSSEGIENTSSLETENHKPSLEEIFEEYNLGDEYLQKVRKAKELSKKEDYLSAAILYLELEAKNGNFAFDAAYNSDMALTKGYSIPWINWHKVIELYKRSNNPAGYFNAGLIFIKIFKSPRNVRLMAERIKKYGKEYLEDANILLDSADKLEAELKGHSPW